MNQNNPKPKILIVDDLPQNLYTLAQLLGKLDIEIIQATSGFKALDLVLQHKFCLAIVDVQMPEMDGYELVELLRSNRVTATMPVIFVSAIFSDEYHYRLGYEAGAVDFLSKPFNPDILLSKVKIFLQLYHQRVELEEKNRTLAKLALELETSSRVGRYANSVLDLDVLLPEVVFMIQTMFKYYFVSLWLVDEEKEALVLQASHSSDNSSILEPGYRLPLDTPESIIVSAYRESEDYLTCDVTADPRYLAIEELPDTRSELALPLQIGAKVLGVLDIQSEQTDVFDRNARMTLLMLANQITIAIHNARLYNLEKSLHELEAQKARELAEVNASKDRFFSIVAHDLRGPFNPLLGLAQLMAQHGVEGVSPDEVKTMAEAIYRSARSVYDLLENLLAWSRLQRGRMDYEAGKLDLKMLADRNVRLFVDVAADKGISLESMIAKGISVNADENMLNTILRNLISNALKFTPRGGQVTVNALSEGSDMVAVAVSDTGMGIRPEDQAKLFRLDTTHSTVGTANETGTGLGLIICQEMVEKNKGHIWIESEGVPGRGTTIKFTLPLLKGPLEGWEFKPVQVVAASAQGEPEMETLAILPPAEKTELLDLARCGDMTAIGEWTAHIETMGEQYAPLANRLRGLAKGFEEGRILALVKQYAGEINE